MRIDKVDWEESEKQLRIKLSKSRAGFEHGQNGQLPRAPTNGR